MKRFIPFAICMLICLSACKKWQHQYPEDSEKTKLTPTERLTNKWWTLQSTSVNGVDYTDSVHTIFGEYRIYFTQNLFDITNVELYYGWVSSNLQPKFTSIWNFNNGEADLGIGPLNGSDPIKDDFLPCYMNNSFMMQYKIEKLLNNELKISVQSKNKDTIVVNYFISN